MLQNAVLINSKALLTSLFRHFLFFKKIIVKLGLSFLRGCSHMKSAKPDANNNNEECLGTSTFRYDL